MSNYQHLLSFSGIRHEDVKGVLELGSRDCLDAMWMARHYGVTVTAFECNPEALVRCRNGLAHWANEPPIHLIPLAVWSHTGPLTFYPVTNGNLGASSAFKANPDYPYERYVQSEVTVDAVRLDEFFGGMAFPNVVCMDLQGAEMEALKGMGERLHEVDVLVSEVQNRRLYHDTPLHEDLTAYLAEFGLVPVKTVAANKWFGDCLYMRQS